MHIGQRSINPKKTSILYSKAEKTHFLFQYLMSPRALQTEQTTKHADGQTFGILEKLHYISKNSRSYLMTTFPWQLPRQSRACLASSADG